MAIRRQRAGIGLLQHFRIHPHTRHVLVEHALGLLVDHRTDIGEGIRRIAQRQHIHGPHQPFDEGLGCIFRQEQNAQGRTALSRRSEGRYDDIVDHLLLQGRSIDKHAV